MLKPILHFQEADTEFLGFLKLCNTPIPFYFGTPVGLVFYIVYFGRMLAFRIKSDILSLTFKSSRIWSRVTLISSHKPLSPSISGFNSLPSSHKHLTMYPITQC